MRTPLCSPRKQTHATSAEQPARMRVCVYIFPQCSFLIISDIHKVKKNSHFQRSKWNYQKCTIHIYPRAMQIFFSVSTLGYVTLSCQPSKTLRGLHNKRAFFSYTPCLPRVAGGPVPRGHAARAMVGQSRPGRWPSVAPEQEKGRLNHATRFHCHPEVILMLHAPSSRFRSAPGSRAEIWLFSSEVPPYSRLWRNASGSSAGTSVQHDIISGNRKPGDDSIFSERNT